MTIVPNSKNQFRDKLPHDLAFRGEHAALEPMQLSHIDDLCSAASDGALWTLKVTEVPNHEKMPQFVSHAIEQREKGRELPFVVRRLSDNRVVGTTRYYYLSEQNRNLSIGYTWYSKSAQRTSINTECKLALLEHAFEQAGCISVQWHTHHENIPSQTAILRLGASFEGVLRNNRILSDGRIRHTHCFSMLDEEWPQAKANLTKKMAHYS